MALRDLLWACPACKTFSSIRDAGRGAERCMTCGTTFKRGRGANIEMHRRDGSTESVSAAALVDRLPPVSTMSLEKGRLGPARALIRIARNSLPVIDSGEYLGRAEIFGPRRQATVTLDHHTLAAGIPENPMVWPLERITAVQPSSSTLQINSRIHPLVSFRFLDHSLRLWEEALQHHIRQLHERAGRGRIIEFHPHIRFA